MSYLFSFRGRINRAKMWLFLLVTLAWEIVVGLVAVFGLNWNRMSAYTDITNGNSHTRIAAVWPVPDKIDTPLEWAMIGVIGLLILLYAVSLLAVYTKRLHDRNKSAWWLILFVVVPFGVKLLKFTAVPAFVAFGENFNPLGVGWGAAELVGAVFGIWGFIELFFFRGTRGDNRYGADPLGPSA